MAWGLAWNGREQGSGLGSNKGGAVGGTDDLSWGQTGLAQSGQSSGAGAGLSAQFAQNGNVWSRGARPWLHAEH